MKSKREPDPPAAASESSRRIFNGGGDSSAAPGDRLVATGEAREDAPEVTLRPQTLEDFTGQAQVRANLGVFIQAARTRGEALDHVLFHGPPGLGKTT
ncbi:MAG: hypothetical protein AAB223_03370, partial [Pseudomonadota bacterium]